MGSLNDHFMSFVQKHSINVLSWGELLKSDWGVMVHIVPPENANPKVGQFRKGFVNINVILTKTSVRLFLVA